jgi:hypothetical protein
MSLVAGDARHVTSAGGESVLTVRQAGKGAAQHAVVVVGCQNWLGTCPCVCILLV